mgnify:CR=1 FL=1
MNKRVGGGARETGNKVHGTRWIETGNERTGWTRIEIVPFFFASFSFLLHIRREHRADWLCARPRTYIPLSFSGLPASLDRLRRSPSL